ncbi:hypothetical protein CP532_6819 [Ophiocordyceps camponoti-leonardi (nom. inval.)]|nr:hypothetical protein CP532_6819 [Ophiocordyceps camponoti-leonardi (nom. inval.)]
MPSRARSAAPKAAVAGASSSASAPTKTRQSNRVTKPTAKSATAKDATAKTTTAKTVAKAVASKENAEKNTAKETAKNTVKTTTKNAAKPAEKATAKTNTKTNVKTATKTAIKTAAKTAAKTNAGKSRKATSNKRKAASQDSESDSEPESEPVKKSEPVPKKKKKTAAAPNKRKSASTEAESESEMSEPAPKKTKTAAPSKKRKAATESKTETDKDERQAKKAKTVASSKKKAVSESKAASDKTKTAASSQKGKSASKAEKAKPAAAPKKSTAASKKSTAVSKAKPEVETAYTVKTKAELAEDIKTIAGSEPKKARFESKVATIGKKINSAPTQPLEVFVFGEGSAGELGLGSTRIDGKKPIDVKRPRLNEKYLSAKDVGVVQIACGGMHAVALTRDNVILTWGVNDNGALGRDTTWSGGLRDVDASDDSDSENEESGLNPLESTPTAVSADHFAPGTKFAQVAACDSATFVLTEDGRVYGWGTFRSNDGLFGFTNKILVQTTPMLISDLKNIKSLAAGANHILALDSKGIVLAWGSGQQNQLGRRIVERNKMASLIPQSVGLPRGKIVKIACGGYHSFAVDNDGHVWGWGLNNFGEIWAEGDVGEDNAIILRPVKLTSLYDWKIVDIDGGVHHSVACSDTGDLITWGRMDGYQVGFEIDSMDKDDVICDELGTPRILSNPCKQKDMPPIASVAAGTDNSFAVSRDGKVYSWGFSSNYQTGLGAMDEVRTPTMIDNTAIRGKKIVAAYAGGQFSIIVGIPAEAAADGAPKAAASEATATADVALEAGAPPTKAPADGPSEAVATPAEATAHGPSSAVALGEVATADDVSGAEAPEADTKAVEAEDTVAGEAATADDNSTAVATSPKATADDNSTAVATSPKATADDVSGAEAPEANTMAVEADDTAAGEAVADEAAASPGQRPQRPLMA